MRRLMSVAVLTSCGFVAGHAQRAGSQTPAAPPTASPATLHWAPVPALFPQGAEIALERGDPTQPGEFVADLSMPDGYRWPGHYHSGRQFVLVRSGTLIVGLVGGAGTRAMTAGDTATVPAGTRYFTRASGRTIIVVTARYPYDVTYVKATDDPLYRPSFPF